MTKEQLEEVTDFQVGRNTYGSVLFYGKTNLFSKFVSDLDNILIINELSVELYPLGWSEDAIHGEDGGRYLPKIGEGLNKPALVTLERCYPKDKDLQRVYDKKKISKFEEKLRKKTQDMGAQFISYNAEFGQWKFEVQHF
eukprot:c16721_g1_i1.p1 GENE.c16721_g1_i1~~c16721_g1_i1.p1  ORF type:complete len:140 (+),score=68.35 c16721_g1_i1:516-935(+)